MPPNSGTADADLANDDAPSYIRKMDRRLIVLETRFDTILPTLSTKADLAELKTELKGDVKDLRMEMRESIGALRTEILAFKVDIHKWMTASLITIFLGFSAMIATMLALLRPG